ncbi:MAG: hypothetical protein ACI4KG_06510 [Oscillospiraceae bacterium]
MEINFHIPDFTNHLYLNSILINTVSKTPKYFHDGLRIASVFGCFGSCVWNGGRFLGGGQNLNAVKHITGLLNEKGIPLRFTFTNPLVEKKHLGDSYCNQILRIADNGMNEVIVMSPILEEYIRKNYPNYKITSSTCKQIENMDGVKEELKKDYKYVVLDYNFNNKFDMLEQIDEADRSRCEILVNACCTPGCKRRGEHYRCIGQDQIREWEHSKDMLSKKPFKPDEFKCEFMMQTLYDTVGYSTHVSPQAIIEKYLPMGFNNFKIEGRTVPDINLLEAYIYYLVKPEYQNEVRLKMLLTLTGKHKYFM